MARTRHVRPHFPGAGAAMSARELLLLLACACVRGSVITAKEYICKDPDTGSLHVVNTTWPSTSFCGNYFCGLRKADPQAAKIIINVTSQARTSHHKDKSDTKDDAEEFSLSKILPDISKENDRLLTPEEILKIMELLHTVKKSDLQAVIELYNVAQDIYKEMDGDTKVQKDFDSAEKSRASESAFENPSNTIKNKISYWYEPENEYRKENDMKFEGSEYRTTTTYPARSQYEQPYYYAQKIMNYPSYFTGSILSNNDFGRIGYYEPVTRAPPQASYDQRRNVYGVPGAFPQPPCNPCARTYQYQAPLPANVAGANYPQGIANNMLQPYPPAYNYSTHTYTNYNNNYYKGNPWAYYDYYRNYPYATAAAPQAQIQKTPENSPGKSETEEDDQSWKTDPLSDTVINEVRANIAERGKLINIPLKKRIKLERVAKVIKMDNFNERKTRSVSDDMYDTSPQDKSNDVNGRLESEEELETYIEKVTCETPTEPGYFRVGNMTQPFPHCCPEKIENKR